MGVAMNQQPPRIQYLNKINHHNSNISLKTLIL